MSERIFYLVSPDSPVGGVIKEANAEQASYQKAVWSFAETFGSKKIYYSTAFSVFLIGLAFESEPPTGWRNTAKGFAVPDKRIKAGRDIASRMKDLPHGMSAARFSDMLESKLAPQSYTHFCDNNIAWTTFETIGSKLVLSVPAACKASPPGCRELKVSEYWRIREAHEAKAKSAKRSDAQVKKIGAQR